MRFVSEFREFAVKGTFNTREKGYAGPDYGGWVMPVLAYGWLYIRTEKEVLCLQAAEKIPSREEVGRCLGIAAEK